MTRIKNLIDLKIGQEYFFSFGEIINTKGVFLGMIYEPERSNVREMYFAQIRYKKWTNTNLVYLNEIGVGNTIKEAKANYGKLDGCYPDTYSNYDLMIEKSREILSKY